MNATVKLVCFDWGAYDTKMQTIIASGEEFDIAFTAVWTNNYRNNSGRGAFLPLNDLLTKYAPKTKAALGADFLAGSAIDGVNYAIPANKEKAHNWGFIIRKDLVAKYKMDLSKVKKLEDMEPFLKTIKDSEPGMYPLEACVGESPRFFLDFDKLVDDDIPVSLYSDNRSSKAVFELAAPETVALYQTMHKFYDEGLRPQGRGHHHGLQRGREGGPHLRRRQVPEARQGRRDDQPDRPAVDARSTSRPRSCPTARPPVPCRRSPAPRSIPRSPWRSSSSSTPTSISTTSSTSASRGPTT